MSGQQLGTAVGFVAGFFLPGGPQVWAAIGGFIGGVIDPTEIKGPHIGDGPQQSANEGAPIAWVLGTAGWLQGNIVQISPRREVKKEDDGKGGPVTVTYEAHQDYCIMAAESCELRDSTIVGVLLVRVNGNIVYDMREGSNFGAENAKFLQHHTFYYGAEDQLPDPTMEAITGIGNTPAYRGVFTMVARDVNLTEYGGAIPTYEFVLVGEGESNVVTTNTYVTPRLSRFADSDFPLADPLTDYAYTGYIGTTQSGGGSVSYAGDSIQDVIDYFTSLDYSALGGGARSPVNYLGYSATTRDDVVPGIGLDIGDFGVSNAVEQPTVVDNEVVVLVYNDLVPNGTHATIGFSGYCSIGGNIEQDKRGKVAKIFASAPGGQYQLAENCGGNNLYGPEPLCIRVTRREIVPVPVYGDPCLLQEPVLLPGSPGYVVDCDGNVFPEPDYSSENGTFRRLHNGTLTFVPELDRMIYEIYPVGPTLALGDEDYFNAAFWTGQYNAAVLRGDLPSGWTYGVEYPDNATTAMSSESSSTSLTSNALSVASAIERICARGGLGPLDTDTADIDATLQGYPIQADYNAADCIKPLLAYCSSFASEYDSQIHFHNYGEPIEITINADDFIEGSEVTDDGSREQAKEYPRKVSVSYVDIEQNYTVRPQHAYRTTPDVRAIGEETIQIPLCDTADHAAKIAEIAIKVAYARLQGTRQFSVPYVGSATYLKLVPGMPFALDGKRWVANRVTLEDGLIEIDAAYDRQSAYTSFATGVPAPTPTPPVSTVGGVTLFAGMNLPRLRSKDNTPGMYIAVAGLLPSWPGCVLQMSIDEGATWTTAIGSMTQASVLGYLTSSVDDTPSDTMSVSVHGGELNSITPAQIADGGNPIAVVTSGVAEIMQFKDAAETVEDHYDLTNLTRGGLGTAAVPHYQGDRFVHLGNIYFLPLDISLSGRTIRFRPVTFGTVPETNASYDVVFSPLFTGPEVSRPLTVSGADITVGGFPIYVVT